VNLINLTPHDLTVYLADGTTLTIPPSGVVARVSQDYTPLGTLNLGNAQVPLVATTYGAIQGLPDPVDGVFYITSALVAQAAWSQGRKDVLAPDTGAGAVRDDQGRIVGVRRLLAHPDLKL